jgi:6-pyruvoyltetrahydropterin/6-carboxytetrahydropterin synthase
MKVELRKTFHFEAAHALTNAPEGHRCRQLHGHTYEVDVLVEGQVDDTIGWYMDYGDISEAVKPLIKELDHRMLNDVHGLKVPTSEHLCIWLWERLDKKLPGLKEIRVRETPSSQCRYRGPNA